MSTTIAKDSNGVPVQAVRFGSIKTLAFNGTSAQTAAIGDCTLVRLVATQACYVTIGDNPTASASTGVLLAEMAPEYFAITPGQEIAAIQVASGGSLNIMECA